MDTEMVTGIEKDAIEIKEDEVRDDRLKRLESKKTHWLNIRMAREIVIELVTNSQRSAMKAMEDWCRSDIMELLMTEVVVSCEVAWVMRSVELVTGTSPSYKWRC